MDSTKALAEEFLGNKEFLLGSWYKGWGWGIKVMVEIIEVVAHSELLFLFWKCRAVGKRCHTTS